jgi:hypothetical protein
MKTMGVESKLYQNDGRHSPCITQWILRIVRRLENTVGKKSESSGKELSQGRETSRYGVIY